MNQPARRRGYLQLPEAQVMLLQPLTQMRSPCGGVQVAVSLPHWLHEGTQLPVVEHSAAKLGLQLT